jgi:uncharacterized cupin superfamily protein
MTIPLIDFAGPFDAPVQDRPAAERCPGPPPLRSTWSRYQAEDAGLDCGVWASEPGAWRIAFHAGRHEYFYVLSGRIRITADDGAAREFGPGEACVIPAGFAGVFEVLEPTRKHYVMIDRNAPAG